MEYNGCGDNSCIVKKPKGMATNGGCRCHKDPKTAKKAIVYLARKVEAYEKILRNDPAYNIMRLLKKARDRLRKGLPLSKM